MDTTTKHSAAPAPMTSGARHTPGPWSVDERAPTAAYGYGHKASLGAIYVKGAGCVMQLIADGSNRQEARANAALIAAAPTLLEALERILSIKGSTGGAESLVKEYRFIAEQALAKVNQ